MKLDKAQKIVAQLEDAGIEARLYKGYSGRCMFGAETDAVVVKHGHNAGEARRVARGLQSAKTDSLGLGVIFY